MARARAPARGDGAAGHELVPRLAVHPGYVADLDRWCARPSPRPCATAPTRTGWPARTGGPRVATRRRRAPGCAACPGGRGAGGGRARRRPARGGAGRGRGSSRLLGARGTGLRARPRRRRRGCAARSTATTCRTSSRGTSTTPTSATSAAASAPSPRGSLAEDLRGAPYLVPLDEIARRAREAWDRGAAEICLQGGIHPAFTGDFYLDVVRAVKSEVPDLHVHAFRALEVWQGAATLGVRHRRTTSRGCGTPAWRRCRAPPRRSSTTRCARCCARTRSTRRSGSPCTTRPTAWGCARRRRSCTAPWRAAAAGRGTCCALREQQRRTGGFTEFVPLPFVHMEAPIYRRGRARPGPTFREAILVHAVARLVLHPGSRTCRRRG